ncbi:unnamed protein product, partial [Prorocentrum cordatum]
WRAAGGARVAAARGGARGTVAAIRCCPAGLSEREGCWQRRIAATVQARGQRWLAGSWRRTRGGCPLWCSRHGRRHPLLSSGPLGERGLLAATDCGNRAGARPAV